MRIKVEKAKTSFVISIIVLILTVFTWTQEYHGFYMAENGVPQILLLIFAYFFPIIFLALLITGIYYWSTRNTLSKNEKIDELERRLKMVEDKKSKHQNDSDLKEKKE